MVKGTVVSTNYKAQHSLTAPVCMPPGGFGTLQQNMQRGNMYVGLVVISMAGRIVLSSCIIMV